MKFLSTCFCLLTLSCNAQNNIKNYTEAYDLTFKMGRDSAVLCPWRENAAYSNYAIPVPSDGLFTQVYFKQFPFIDRLKTEFEQRILLPDNNEKKGKVLFECKGTNIALLY
ncbi:MAG: hypothetical protein LBQ73_10810, partial [Tannerellaceae bacterium]|nr:hypothetical protein [Tannerellaceae bacterium]